MAAIDRKRRICRECAIERSVAHAEPNDEFTIDGGPMKVHAGSYEPARVQQVRFAHDPTDRRGICARHARCGARSAGLSARSLARRGPPRVGGRGRDRDTRIARAAAGTGRGGDLSGHDDWMQESLCNSRGLLDVKTYRQLWAEMRTLPRGDSPDVVTHGDLIAPNVLVGAGRLVGVLDVGGLGAADPALDLVAAWHLLDSGPRRRLRDHLGCDDAEWLRGRAWASERRRHRAGHRAGRRWCRRCSTTPRRR